MLGALIIVVAGLLLIAGKKDLGARALAAGVGLMLVVSCLPFVIDGCASSVSGTSEAFGAAGAVIGYGLILAVGGATGYVLWRGRERRARVRDLERRRNSAPRGRELPPAPRRQDLEERDR